MKRLTYAAIAAVAAASFAVPTPANASVEGPTWLHAAHHWPNVRVEDHTGPLWPVRASVTAWGSGLHYQACGTSNQCVKVYERNLGNTGTISYTTQVYTTDGGGKTHWAPLQIVINSAYNNRYPYAQREQIVKHELGHALGLGHDTTPDVMNDDGVHSYNYISPANRADLYNLYIR